jgi:hypothetical protein
MSKGTMVRLFGLAALCLALLAITGTANAQPGGGFGRRFGGGGPGGDPKVAKLEAEVAKLKEQMSKIEGLLTKVVAALEKKGPPATAARGKAEQKGPPFARTGGRGFGGGWRGFGPMGGGSARPPMAKARMGRWGQWGRRGESKSEVEKSLDRLAKEIENLRKALRR